MFYHEEEKFAVVSWMDTKRVIVASDFVGLEPLETVSRWSRKEKQYVQVQRPEAINVYNHFMGGVDLADQLVAMNPCPFRWRKWFMRVVCRILDTTVSNAWLMYRSTLQESETALPMSLFEFRRSIATSLLTGSVPSIDCEVSTQVDLEDLSHKKQRYVAPEVRFRNASHMPSHGAIRQRCKIRDCPQKTFWFCTTCNVYLCLSKDRDCFKSFHELN